jgi:hypothetical protein
MKFPNAIIITKYGSHRFDEDGCHINHHYLDFKKIFGLRHPRKAILIYSQLFFNTDIIAEYIKKYNIKSLDVIIDDVFRLQHNKNYIGMDTWSIEKDIKNTQFIEIEIVKELLDKIKLSKVKVYHCENIPTEYKKYFPFKINYIDLYLSYWVMSRFNRINLKHNLDFNYKVSCLNNRKDYHRHYIAALLYDNKDALITHNEGFDDIIDDLINCNGLSLDGFEEPFKSELYKKIKKLNKDGYYYIDSEGVIKNKKHNDEIMPRELQHSNILYNVIENSFLNIVTETRYDSPFQYISEKTLKPIIAKRPFVLLSSPGTLGLLKSLGFKTFDDWWDESYDQEEDHYKRFEMVYDISQDILSKDDETLKKYLREMRKTLDFNYNHLKNLPEIICSKY